MIDFKQVQPSDGQWVRELLKHTDFRGCEYAFSNIYMWSELYSTKIARYKNFGLVKNKYGLLFPFGCGDIRELIDVLKKQELCFTNVNPKSLELLKCLYGNQIEITSNRDYYDYVYDFDTLSRLCGRKLHSKRNHLNRFYENNWKYEPITPDNIEEVTQMHNLWCNEKNIYSDRDKLKEAGAVIRGLEKFFELGMTGGIIRVQDPDCKCNWEIQAYTYGGEISNRCNDTFVVHVEKAFTKFQGTYAAINHEFVNRACKGYRYINREEDMGAENLRKAKMSYCPAFMEEKYRVIFK
jgi:hypothetical protein